MIDTEKQTVSKGLLKGKQRTYNEIVVFLNQCWKIPRNEKSLSRIKILSKALGEPEKKFKSIFFGGNNGKSLTIYFAAQLFKVEKFKVGAFYSPCILNYNEQIQINNETISNKQFAQIANEVLNAAEINNLDCNTQELLMMIVLKHFEQEGVDVALLEIDRGGEFHPVNICFPSIAVITRMALNSNENSLAETAIEDLMKTVNKGTYVISGDQNKKNLNLMNQITSSKKGVWVMPIRKLAPLRYPFEQIHGRCASIAERTVQVFIEKILSREGMIVSSCILTRPKGQRGRPTLEEKRTIETSPKKTVEQFWRETLNNLPCRFQLLDKEKPTILLDNAKNIDSFKNLLLGVRLLHYQQPIKGLAIIVGAAKDSFHNEEFARLIRYFFKKTSGQIYICPIKEALPGADEDQSWDVEKITTDMKGLKIKAFAKKSFEEAFASATNNVDDRNGLVIITGSNSIINNYWKLKGIKKL